MSHGPIRKLHVQENIRQVDAAEVATWRYLLFMTVVVGAGVGLANAPPEMRRQPWLYIAGLALIAIVFRPWHRMLNVDLDTETLTVSWRVLGILPFWRRSYPLEGQRFTVETQRHLSEGGGAGWGCLAMALPFPLSLLSLFAGDSGAKPVVRIALCLRDSSGGLTPLLLLNRREVVGEWLDAVEELRPEAAGQR